MHSRLLAIAVDNIRADFEDTSHSPGGDSGGTYRACRVPCQDKLLRVTRREMRSGFQQRRIVKLRVQPVKLGLELIKRYNAGIEITSVKEGIARQG